MHCGVTEDRLAEVSPELRSAILTARWRVERAMPEAGRELMLRIKGRTARQTRKAREIERRMGSC